MTIGYVLDGQEFVEEPPSCTRCGYGLGNHTCWRVEIQAMPSVKIYSPPQTIPLTTEDTE